MHINLFFIMKRFICFIISVLMLASCFNSNNSSKSSSKQPIATYIYDGNKEICLFSGDSKGWKPATVDGQSAQWYESEKDFYHSDGISLQTTTRECIYIDRDDVYGIPDIIIWPGTGLAFFGLENMAAGEKDPSNERLGKRCYRKR